MKERGVQELYNQSTNVVIKLHESVSLSSSNLMLHVCICRLLAELIFGSIPNLHWDSALRRSTNSNKEMDAILAKIKLRPRMAGKQQRSRFVEGCVTRKGNKDGVAVEKGQPLEAFRLLSDRGQFIGSSI